MAKAESNTPVEKLAAVLDGHELREFDAVAATYKAHASQAGLVMVFGASDDLMELRGAIDDEVGMQERGRIPAYIAAGDLLTNECDERDDCPYFPALQAKAFKIEGLWLGADPEDGTITTEVWTYRLDVKHSTFTIFEDGEAWCRGVVFALADLPAEGGS